jgi:hypothetical protein
VVIPVFISVVMIGASSVVIPVPISAVMILGSSVVVPGPCAKYCSYFCVDSCVHFR